MAHAMKARRMFAPRASWRDFFDIGHVKRQEPEAPTERTIGDGIGASSSLQKDRKKGVDAAQSFPSHLAVRHLPDSRTRHFIRLTAIDLIFLALMASSPKLQRPGEPTSGS